MYAQNTASLVAQHPWQPPTQGVRGPSTRRPSGTMPPGPPPSQPIPPPPLGQQQQDRAVHPYASAAYSNQGAHDDNPHPHHALLRNFTRASAIAGFSRQPSAQGPAPVAIPTSPPRESLSPSFATTGRAPSSRRALTAALELAQEAVRLDSDEEPFAAVNAYARSISLLSEVMERVRVGDEPSEGGSSRRRPRQRSVVAREDEVQRLRSIVSYLCAVKKISTTC